MNHLHRQRRSSTVSLYLLIIIIKTFSKALCSIRLDCLLRFLLYYFDEFQDKSLMSHRLPIRLSFKCLCVNHNIYFDMNILKVKQLNFISNLTLMRMVYQEQVQIVSSLFYENIIILCYICKRVT